MSGSGTSSSTWPTPSCTASSATSCCRGCGIRWPGLVMLVRGRRRVRGLRARNGPSSRSTTRPRRELDVPPVDAELGVDAGHAGADPDRALARPRGPAGAGSAVCSWPRRRPHRGDGDLPVDRSVPVAGRRADHAAGDQGRGLARAASTTSTGRSWPRSSCSA